MSLGKYSPTVSHSYALDQEWWERNGGGFDNGTNPQSDDDNDGFDRYGYSGNGCGPDRAGHSEMDYLNASTEAYRQHNESGDDYDFEDDCSIYFDVAREWCTRALGDLPNYVSFGDISRNQMGEQCQYGSRYITGMDGYPQIGAGLRFRNLTENYHKILVHRDDVEEMLVHYRKVKL